MLPLSVFLITKNEASNLPRCLEAIKDIADEIVIVDSGSTDNTEEIAKCYGAKFSFRTFDGFGQQKYYTEQLCRNDWVLNLDADEFATPELLSEIRDFFESGKDKMYDGARLKTVSVYPHKDKPRLFADYHNYIRLYRKSVLNFPEHPTYDAVIAKDERRIYQLKNIALHYSYETIEALEQKKKVRTKFYFEKEKKGSALKNIVRLPFEFPHTFIKSYIFRRQFTGGIYGLRISLLHAKYRHLRIMQRVCGKCLVKED